MKKAVVPAALVIGLAVVVLSALFVNRRLRQRQQQTASVAGAVEYIRAMEAGNPEEVISIIRQHEREQFEAERAQMREALLSGELDVWSLFQDYVFLGDSRVTGFFYYGFLPSARVLAGSGDTIRSIEPLMDEIVALHPSRVYLSFGINDLNIGFWNDPDEYTAEFVETADMMREALPELEIYVNSILPVQDFALKNGAEWYRVPEYNIALREMCEEHGYVFVDNDGIVAEHQDEYSEDGIHLNDAFYPYWGTNNIIATLYSDPQ